MINGTSGSTSANFSTTSQSPERSEVAQTSSRVANQILSTTSSTERRPEPSSAPSYLFSSSTTTSSSQEETNPSSLSSSMSTSTLSYHSSASSQRVFKSHFSIKDPNNPLGNKDLCPKIASYLSSNDMLRLQACQKNISSRDWELERAESERFLTLYNLHCYIKKFEEKFEENFDENLASVQLASLIKLFPTSVQLASLIKFFPKLESFTISSLSYFFHIECDYDVLISNLIKYCPRLTSISIWVSTPPTEANLKVLGQNLKNFHRLTDIDFGYYGEKYNSNQTIQITNGFKEFIQFSSHTLTSLVVPPMLLSDDIIEKICERFPNLKDINVNRLGNLSASGGRILITKCANLSKISHSSDDIHIYIDDRVISSMRTLFTEMPEAFNAFKDIPLSDFLLIARDVLNC